MKNKRIKLFSYGLTESEKEVEYEKENYTKTFVGRRQFIRRGPLKINREGDNESRGLK